MHVHRSNSTEALVDVLEQIVREPVGEPTDPECIVVQGRGMERWLSTELSRRLGIWANPSFPFPRNIIDRAFESVLGDSVPRGDSFQPGALVWSIAKMLPEYIESVEFATIKNYLKGDDEHRERIQLAARIAETFDSYAIYRPELVLGWERGVGNEWQAVLWRALVKVAPDSTHTAALAHSFFARIVQQVGPIEGFPPRVNLFCISTLPPLYMRILSALSSRVEIRLFVLSPSREYWGDIRSLRDMLRAQFADSIGEPPTDEVLPQPDGNPLLVSMGRLHGDFQQVLETTDDYVEAGEAPYRDLPATGEMLATLQSDILALRYRHPGNQTVPPLVLAASDDSVSVHSCHGPMRELEVLHDQLVSIFDEQNGPEARDVVVMMPDVEEYAPLIDAVFGCQTGDRPRIPYQIADRSSRASDDVVDAFARVLGVLAGRMTAPEVLDVLSIDVVRERFGIHADDMGVIRTWVVDVGIRWGADRKHRGAVGQPEYDENTWRFGLDRLLLGYAMMGSELFGGVLPYENVEGSSTALLGRFIEYCDALFLARHRFQEQRGVAGWRTELQRLLADLVVDTELNASQHQELREGFADLADHAEAAGFDTDVPIDSIRSLLEAEWQRRGSARGFMSGGVTFCQMSALRSVPFRVVCLVGLSDGAFPRSPQPMGFDLIAESPRIGDHAPRDDDRYLFLEALLSAQDRLLVTYVGQSIQNNRNLPPSVLVGELLDTLDESFRLDPAGEDEPVRDRIVVRHPLQPFSPRYFSDGDEPRLFSYSGGYCDAAQAVSRTRRDVPPFLAGPLPSEGDEERVVTVDELARYFMRPSQVFTERRLGLSLQDDDESLEDREPVALGGLDAWSLGDRLLTRVLAGESPNDALESARGSGEIPLGTVGIVAFSELSNAAAAIGRVALAWQDGEKLDGVPVGRQLDDTRITGSLTELWPRAQVMAQFSRIGKRQELGLWIKHLVLCWLAPDGCPDTSVAIGQAPKNSGTGAIRLTPVQDPESHLRELVRLYWIGQTAPLPFFPEAARCYVSQLADLDSPEVDERALARSHDVFVNERGGPGEAFDPCVRQLFGAVNPLDPTYRPFADVPAGYPGFPEVARAVFIPFLAHRKVL